MQNPSPFAALEDNAHVSGDDPTFLGFLDEIPSETTPAERLLLFNLFKDTWDGRTKVVEIGPFLGGTTRAIASGMLLNTHLSSGAEFHTLDRFSAYHDPVMLRSLVEPLVRSYAMTSRDADQLCQKGDFLKLFNAIHEPYPYYRLLQIHNSSLPDLPHEIDGSQALSWFGKNDDLGALFVDGCKSWASTHYALAQLLPKMRPGAPVIFQDFGWYTCFWITSAAFALKNALELEQWADSTYVFRLQSAITADEISQRFGRSPEEMGPHFFQNASAFLMERSRKNGDLRGELISILHHVAALVTLDRKAEAFEILKTADPKKFAAFESMMLGAIKSPTYRPGGEPVRWI